MHEIEVVISIDGKQVRHDKLCDKTEGQCTRLELQILDCIENLRRLSNEY